MIPVVVMFADPPGLDGTLAAGIEAGDVVLHLGLAGQPFCMLVITMEDALDLNLKLAALIVEQKRETQP